MENEKQYIPLNGIPKHIHEAAQSLNHYFEKEGMRYWEFCSVADRRLVNKLERERDEARERERVAIASWDKERQERNDLQKAVNGLCEHFGVSPANTTLLAVEVLRIKSERDKAHKIAERAIDDLAWFNETNAQRLRAELDKIKEGAK